LSSPQSCSTVFFKDSISPDWALIIPVPSMHRIQSPSLAPPGVGGLSGGELLDSVLPRFALFSAFSAASLSIIFCLQVGQSLYLTPTPWCSIFAVRNRGRAGSSSCLLHTPANVCRCQFQKKKSNIHSLASHTPNPGTFSWPLLRGMGRNSSQTRHDRLSAPVRADWSFFL